ncbi:uncharacterized protein CEXT_223411 [Caerostris extrusa]|uniref:Uncharacterized protein n=1 Tax=Caerostris extrusa TaxID=172846 RepID=A0AAV4YAC1_CAEEX|nr:uncharacterized protein CEXT_223411 [Caerostris extrusa]
MACVASGFTSDPFSIGKYYPPFGIPSATPEAEKEIEIEEIAKKLSMDKSWPFVEKDIIFDKGIDLGIGLGKELEFEKEFDLSKIAGLEKEKEFDLSKFIGLEKSISIEKTFPWWMYEKYFGTEKEEADFRTSFVHRALQEVWVLWTVGRSGVAQTIPHRPKAGSYWQRSCFPRSHLFGLFKGIGLEKIFEAVNEAIGAEKKKTTAIEFENAFALFKKF